MKKKIILLIVALLLPAFVLFNTLASDSNNNVEDEIVEINNDIMIDSPLFTSKETGEQYTQNVSLLEFEDFEMQTSNASFELWTNEATAAIRIKNLKTGYVWASDILNIDNYQINAARKRQYTSAFTMEYRDEKNATKSVHSSESNITIRVKTTNDTVKFTVNNTAAKIKFEYTVQLTESGIELNLPYESIVESGDSKLISLSLYPNLGAVFGNSIPGYLFIPSGNGGLIRFDKTPAINQAYTVGYYGSDANRTRNNESIVLSLPVYGVTHGVEQNAMFARIKNGAGFANFNYVPSTMNQIDKTVDDVTTTNGFHFAYNTYNYRQDYNIQVPGTENPILMIPEEFYQSDITVSYTFLSGKDADYVGMAQAYQQQLKDEGIINENSNAGSGSVHLDILGGETESGIVFDKYIKMTTTDQLLEINDELTKKFSNKFVYTLRGFNKNGYSNQSASNIKMDSRLGRISDLDNLDYYMYYNPVESYSSKNSAPNTTLVNVFNEENYITVEENVKYKFYANVDTVIEGVENAVSKYTNSVAFDGLGYRLYGDKNSNYTREEVIDKYSKLVTSTSPMFKPSEYMLASTSHYMNMPLYHDRVRFVTDSVPFLQIALRGYIDYYSTYINFSTNQDVDLLKCVEYGSNLAYLISYEESHLLANSLSSHLYATNYASNKELMFDQINDVSIALNHVVNETIEDRQVLASGIVEVAYSNGVKIYVNYTSQDYQYNNITIETMSYKVVS